MPPILFFIEISMGMEPIISIMAKSVNETVSMSLTLVCMVIFDKNTPYRHRKPAKRNN
jgi:hypothetical protein